MTALNQPENSVTPTNPSFYKTLLDDMSDGVYFVDRDRRILYWNKGAIRLTGYQSEEMVGRCCQDNTLCHVDAAGRNLCHDGCPLTASISDGGSHEAPVFLRHKQGRRVPVWFGCNRFAAPMARSSVRSRSSVMTLPGTLRAAKPRKWNVSRFSIRLRRCLIADISRCHCKPR